MKHATRFIHLAAALTAASAPLAAQTVGTPQQGQYGFALEAMRPEIKSLGNLENTGATVFLSGHAELKPGARLLVEVPFVFSKTTVAGISESSSSIGNPYLGVQLQKNWLTVDVGGRAPLASSEEIANLLGMVTDLDRLEAFIPDGANASAVARVEGSTPAGFAVAGFGGPAYMIYTGDESDVDNELFLVYGAEASYRAAMVHAGARISGRYLATEEEGDFGKNSSHQIGLFANLGRGSIRPTLQFRIPLDDDMSDEMKWSGGLGVQVLLGRR